MKSVWQTFAYGKVGVIRVWIIVVILIAAGIWYFKRKSASSDSSGDSTDASGNDSSNLDTGTLQQALPYQGSTSVTIINPTTPPTSTTPTTGSTGTTGTGTSTTGTTTGGTTGTGGTTPPPTKKKSISYVVKSGDTLTKIASKEHVSLSSLEQQNKTVIESTAKKHGHNTNFDNWIFPGEKLVIPA